MEPLQALRAGVRARHRASEADLVADLIAQAGLDAETRGRIATRATGLVEAIRADGRPGLMEVFLAEYGLSTKEGVALMCLAEALLRVPDADTIDALIEDKIAPSAWGAHLGRSSSPLVNASTWALMFTGAVLREGEGDTVAQTLRSLVKRVGEPVIRAAVTRAMKELGGHFVLGETIEGALSRAAADAAKGFSHSYDMLGEAALTAGDAEAYYDAYRGAIATLGARARATDIRDNPGISIKLSALHPRYEFAQRERVLRELTPWVLTLALDAKAGGLGLNIDAEEADRLDLSLDLVDAVLRDPRLAGWDGFGVVVQAYGKRASAVIDWLYALAGAVDRRIMVRLVKGAYWDTEVKRAQVDGVADFPVFTRKAATDIAFIACAKKLLGMTDRIYPQFATHNAHAVAAVLELARDRNAFEFQRLHGMGETLHRLVHDAQRTRCRIYAPVGAHRDLLAYLVRRLLENGANSSFVNQILDDRVSADDVAADPFAAWDEPVSDAAAIAPPPALWGSRLNARGWDLQNTEDCAAFDAARAPFRQDLWRAAPILADGANAPRGGEDAAAHAIANPADLADIVGYVRDATSADVEAALEAARPWTGAAIGGRADVLRRAADLYEARHGEIFALLAREAGKTGADAVAELREAVDFLRYYAAEGDRQDHAGGREPWGVFACISPWNFPLAIFTGQIAAALTAGNGVIAKPAEQTPLIAAFATGLLHEAGVPRAALQLLPGPGAAVGAALTADARIAGVCFTGSTATAQAINRAMAQGLDPAAPLIAETGGINAMIVDSTALLEQAVRDVVASAFRSAGQRCSALRMLYVQADIADAFKEMLFGAMDELRLGDPWDLAVDVGPVITEAACADQEAHIAAAAREGRLLKRVEPPTASGSGHIVPPAVIAVSGIDDVEREVFGPVLHVATFRAEDLATVLRAVNGRGYGLTFGLHTRIDDRVEAVVRSLNVGNTYVNRNQIGAIVGSQPFGGEGLSGTGPKAGGPDYLPRFVRAATRRSTDARWDDGTPSDPAAVQAALDALAPPSRAPLGDAVVMPGPTGESNRLTRHPRGVVLCLGPTAADAAAQRAIAEDGGCRALAVAAGWDGPGGVAGGLDPEALAALRGFDAVVHWGSRADQERARHALARRDGPVIPLLTEADFAPRCVVERHLCVDTTAAGGDAALLARSA